MAEIIAHPETGAPVRKVETFEALDRSDLEAALTENEADLEQLLADKRAAFEASLNEDEDVKAARSAVEDSKSELSKYDEIAPAEPAADAGAAVEDPSPTEEGVASDELSESDGAVAVDITVEETVAADEY